MDLGSNKEATDRRRKRLGFLLEIRQSCKISKADATVRQSFMFTVYSLQFMLLAKVSSGCSEELWQRCDSGVFRVFNE